VANLIFKFGKLLYKKKGIFIMYFKTFICIIDDEKMDLNFCLKNEYLQAVLTAQEMTVIIPFIQKLMSYEYIDEILVATGLDFETLVSEYSIPSETLDRWFLEDFSEYEKRDLVYKLTSGYLEDMRRKTCQMCGAEYFSKEPNSDVCDKCAAEIYKHYIG
jgi:hypothetical protein